MLKIGEFSKLSRVSIRMLRHYDEMGLLKPFQIDPCTGAIIAKNSFFWWGILVNETESLHLIPDDPCYCSAIFHDGEYKEKDVDVEAQKTVKGTYPDTEHVKFKTLPAVTFASATYKGPYSLINEVNAAVAQWIRDNGYEYDGLTFNIYHVSPHETDDPNEFVTEVCYPVRKK